MNTFLLGDRARFVKDTCVVLNYNSSMVGRCFRVQGFTLLSHFRYSTITTVIDKFAFSFLLEEVQLISRPMKQTRTAIG